jgi:hypothetical protein
MPRKAYKRGVKGNWRKLQYQRVKDCGESECQQDESLEEIITCWIESYNSLERGQIYTWSSTRNEAESNFFENGKFSYEN